MIWLLAVLGIPLLVCVLLFFSAMEDFWQIVTFRIDISRFFGDLVHVMLILGVGVIAEIFSLFELVKHLF